MAAPKKSKPKVPAKPPAARKAPSVVSVLRPKNPAPAVPAAAAERALEALQRVASANKESFDDLNQRAVRLSNKLRNLYGKRGTALDFNGPFQLLVATVLSAQCTDARVNMTTPGLFAEFPDAPSCANASTERIETLIKSTGFYHQKTKSIINLSKDLVVRFGGEVPRSMEELTSLPGVGRKTANLVRGMVWGEPALIVDTHFRRVSGRLGLVEADNPDKVEFEIAELLPPSHWTEFSNSLIWHGRDICPARKPKCEQCPVLDDCVFGQSEVG